jgi:hypothetical protein
VLLANQFGVSLRIKLQIAGREQLYFLKRPTLAELCDLCRTRPFRNLVRAIAGPRHKPSELPSSLILL